MRSGVTSDWRNVTAYFALTGLLTVPFWIAGGLVAARLMPGLSIAAFAVVVPTISACIVAAMTGGLSSVRSLFASLRHTSRQMPVVVAVAVGVPLAATFVSWVLAAPDDRVFVTPLALLALVPIFLIAAIAEEIGWSAFATERLHGQLGAAAAGLVVGLAWAVWHVPTLIELGRSAEWMAWWAVWTVATRVIIATLYVRAGSWIWAPIVLHATSNLVWQAAPDAFDPRIEGLVIATIALGTALWSRRTA
ncbi:MAG: CPBP family intramembrane glutamic endopeptidase [Devosia sp.]